MAKPKLFKDLLMFELFRREHGRVRLIKTGDAEAYSAETGRLQVAPRQKVTI